MYGKTEIAVRRDVKRRVVELLVTCAEKGAQVIKGNGVLQPEQVGNITVDVREFVWKLNDEEISALQTAKGCTKAPPDLIEFKTTEPLLDFLKIPMTSVDQAGCMAGFVGDGIRWAKQVAKANPHSNINWAHMEFRLKEAADRVVLSFKAYARDPSQRDPRDVDEARYWLHYRAYVLGGDKDMEDKANILICERAWQKEFDGMAKHLRENPGLTPLRDRFMAVYQRAEDWYLMGNLPADVR